MLSKMALNNYRMAGYLLLAIGLINLRYQTGHSNVLAHSLFIIVPGVLLIGVTFLRSAQNFLAKREVMWVLAALGAALVVWAITN